MCVGDFHYGDNFVDDVDDYRQVFDVQLAQPGQAALYASTPIAYVWDDHDYGPNDSDGDSPSRAAAMLAYREYVPHYELAGPETAIYQAFSIGTVRVVLTDARSTRDPHGRTDDADKSLLGDAQRRWLLDELLTASTTHDLVIWVNPVPWVTHPEPGGDSWSGYTTERSLIADHIAEHDIDNLLMVCGDAHMVAIDDGTHTSRPFRGTAFPSSTWPHSIARAARREALHAWPHRRRRAVCTRRRHTRRRRTLHRARGARLARRDTPQPPFRGSG